MRPFHPARHLSPRHCRHRCGRRLGAAVRVALALLVLAAPLGAGAAESARVGASGLPLPRFVSLRSGEVNLRTGPGTRYPIDWIYRRRGLPVQVIDEFDTWRRVRDHQGTEGWMHRSMLAARRTVIVTGTRPLLHRRPDPASPGLAYLEAGVIAGFVGCDGAWCRVDGRGFEGWLGRPEVWGLGPDD